MSGFLGMRGGAGTTDDDVFLRPPLWEDIASSIQNIDPENANMLGTLSAGINGINGISGTISAGINTALNTGINGINGSVNVNGINSVNGQNIVKLEVSDDLVAACTPSPLLSPLEIKTEKVSIYFDL